MGVFLLVIERPSNRLVYLRNGSAQFYVLPHWDRSCRSNFLPHPVTVYWHWADQSQCWSYNTRHLAGWPLECQFLSHWYDSTRKNPVASGIWTVDLLLSGRPIYPPGHWGGYQGNTNVRYNLPCRGVYHVFGNVPATNIIRFTRIYTDEKFTSVYILLLSKLWDSANMSEGVQKCNKLV